MNMLLKLIKKLKKTKILHTKIYLLLLQGRMHGPIKTPASPRAYAQRSPRFAAQRSSPAVNTNVVMTASHVQRTNSQPGTVASGLVGLARMMSPKQQSKRHVKLCFFFFFVAGLSHHLGSPV